MQPTYPDCLMIVAANVRILAPGFSGTIPQRQAKAQFLIGWLCICSTLGSQETLWLGNVGANLCEKFDGLHFGIFRAGQ